MVTSKRSRSGRDVTSDPLAIQPLFRSFAMTLGLSGILIARTQSRAGGLVQSSTVPHTKETAPGDHPGGQGGGWENHLELP
jgi:hypothetical protein